MKNPSVASPIQWPSRWQSIRGFAFGLCQPALMGLITARHLPAAQLGHLEQNLTGLLDEALPNLQADVTGEQRLVSRLLFCLGAIQRQSRIPVSEFSHLRARSGQAQIMRFEVALPAPDLRATKVVLGWLVAVTPGLLQQVLSTDALEAIRNAILQKLQPLAHSQLNRYSIIRAANRLEIPIQNLTPTVLVLGTGKYSRWMNSTLTDHTPGIGASIAKDKFTTARVLLAAGLPGGVNALVQSPEQAVNVATQLGFPVVVKPADKDQGEGVAADLRDAASVEQAYLLASACSNKVLVERWAPGATHRLTVFNGKVIRVARRIAAGVTGDGVRDIKTLVASRDLTDTQKKTEYRLGKPLLVLDEEALGLLQQNGFTPSHVPAVGEYIRLRRRDNISAGGTNEHVELDQVHPDNLMLAIDAAGLLRLDFAGIDLIIGDIRQSWQSSGGLVCEVNAQPQMGARPESTIYEDVLRELLNGRFRIPAQLLICPAEPAQRRAALAQLLAAQNANGISDQSGLWVNGRKASTAFATDFDAARALLMRQDIDNAVCIMSLQEIVKHGSPLRRWHKIQMCPAESPTPEEMQQTRQAAAMLHAHADQSDQVQTDAVLPVP